MLNVAHGNTDDYEELQAMAEKMQPKSDKINIDSQLI